MSEMATYGMGELVKEATEYLESAGETTKAGEASWPINQAKGLFTSMARPGDFGTTEKTWR